MNRSIEYVINGVVNSSYFKAIQTAQERLRGLNASLKMQGSAHAAAAKHAHKHGEEEKKEGREFDPLGVGEFAKGAIGAAAMAISIDGLVEGYKGAVEEAIDYQQAIARQQTLMLKVKGTTVAQVRATQAYAERLENVTAIEARVNDAGAGQLAIGGLHAQQIRKLLPLVDDLATAQFGLGFTQDNMARASKEVVKALSGQSGAMGRAGIVFSKAQQKIFSKGTDAQRMALVVEALTKKVGGLSQKMANAPAGAILRLHNAWKRVQTTIGDKLLPLQMRFMNFILAHMPQINAAVDRFFEILDRVGDAWNYVSRISEPLLKYLSERLNIMRPELRALWASAQKLGAAFMKALWPLIKAWWPVVRSILHWLIESGIPAIISQMTAVGNVLSSVFSWVAKIEDKFTALTGTAGKFGTIVKDMLTGDNVGLVNTLFNAAPSRIANGKYGQAIGTLLSGDVVGAAASAYGAANMAGAGHGIVVHVTNNFAPGTSHADVHQGIVSGVDHLKRQLRQIDHDRRRRAFE